MATRTYAIIKFNLEDTTALQSAAFTFKENRDFGDASLVLGNEEAADYGYTGFNQFCLDGSKEEIPDDKEDVAFWSTAISGDDRKFGVNPVIAVKFAENHTSTGLTFFFSHEYPKRMKISWYDIGGELIEEGEFTPAAETYFARMQVKNYAAIRVEFLETHYANRCIRLQYIVFGQYITWSDDDVKAAKVTEQIDESNASLPVSSAQVEIIDENNDFDIANPEGSWNSAEYYQRMVLREYKDGEIIECGTFYLNGWSFKSNIATFKAVDAIGFLDSATFRDGRIYDREPAVSIISEIMAAAGWTDYYIDPDIAQLGVTGYLKKQTCRNALKEVCFALGAQATCFRSETITIRRPERYISNYVGPDRKFNGKTQVATGDYIQAVSVELPSYALGDDTSSVYKATNEPGTYLVEFSSPVDTDTITASGCAVSNVHTQYCTITVPEAGECEILARTYTSTPYTLTREVENVEPGQGSDTKKYTAAVYCPDEILDVMDSLLSYYQLRKSAQITYLLDGEVAGDWIGIRDTQNRISSALVEQQTIDMTGGFLSTAKCVGYSKVTTEDYFAGKELYTGGNVII